MSTNEFVLIGDVLMRKDVIEYVFVDNARAPTEIKVACVALEESLKACPFVTVEATRTFLASISRRHPDFVQLGMVLVPRKWVYAVFYKRPAYVCVDFVKSSGKAHRLVAGVYTSAEDAIADLELFRLQLQDSGAAPAPNNVAGASEEKVK